MGVLLRLDDRVNEENVGDIPLVKYAAQYWVDHARFEKVASRIRDAMEYFFDADKSHWGAWCKVQMIDESWPSFFTTTSQGGFPLYYASLGGFYDLAEHLVGKHPEHINARGGQMETPLVAALHGKHFEVAEILHQNGADVEIRDASEDPLLREACKGGFPEIVQWLLIHGADANAQGLSWPPLTVAAGYGQLEEVQMLIEYNADIHSRNNTGITPLHAAASRRDRDHINIMQVLLDHGANPNARDESNSTPLHRSSWYAGRNSGGTPEGTRLLLKHGATIDAEDNEGRTPLQLALERGRDDIVTCLKEHGATR